MKKKIKLSQYTIAVIAVWAVAALAVLAGYFFMKLPQDAELDQLRTQCTESQTRADYAQMAAIPESQTKLIERCEESERQIETFSTRQDTVTGLVFEIGELADELSLCDFSSKALTVSQYSTVGKSEIITENWLNVEFEGSFDQFVKYVNELERNQPVVFVEKIFFRRGTEGPASNQIKMDLSFLTQTQKVTGSLAMVP